MFDLIEMPNKLLARAGTSDEATWHDVFDEDKAWHRPPDFVTRPEWVLDLGAYVGYTVCDFSSLFPMANIVAVEPDPENYQMLLRNTRVWIKEGPPRIRPRKLIQGAVSNYDGYGRLRGDAYNAKQIENGANVKVHTIDNIVETYKIPKFDFIKFDIEGAERHVLQSGGRWPDITSCVKIEVHENYYVSECIADLQKLGFKATQDSKYDHAVIGTR